LLNRHNASATTSRKGVAMQIGFIGLGRMGGNMVRRILRDSDHEVAAYDPNRKAVKEAEAAGARGARSLKELVSLLDPPRFLWVMVPAGKPTDEVIERLVPLIAKGDTVIDGGNTNYLDDKRRAGELRKHGINYVDVGVSGGVWGLEVGYCMMVGGPKAQVRKLAPILDVLAPPVEGESARLLGKRGWAHLGPTGAGHYVKMVHNGIEYGLMQAYAEGFDLLDKCEFTLDKEVIANLWNQGSVIRSWLLELAARAFAELGPELAEIEGYTADSGEGRWTLSEGIAHDVPMPVLAASLFARFYSRGSGDFTHRMLAALRHQFGGHPVKEAQR